MPSITKRAPTPQRKSARKSKPPQPVGARIRRDIEKHILSGAWEPGHRIPFEHELMAEYGCARMTVSKVLAALAESGLIERRRRAGSFVRRPQNQSAVLDIPDIKAEVLGRSQRYGYALLTAERRMPTRTERSTFDLTISTSVLALRCLHLADETPYAVEDRLIVVDAVPEAARVDFSLQPPGTWLLQHVPWHVAEHLITAANPDLQRARLLAIGKTSACLVLTRRTWRSGTLLTAVRIWYAGTAQTLVARFTPLSSRGR